MSTRRQWMELALPLLLLAVGGTGIWMLAFAQSDLTPEALDFVFPIRPCHPGIGIFEENLKCGGAQTQRATGRLGDATGDRNMRAQWRKDGGWGHGVLLAR